MSYVLNNTPGQSIPEATRQRVLDAARRVGYVPSGPARALRSGRSEIVLMIMPDWPQGSSATGFTEALADSLGEAGLTLVTHHLSERRPVPTADLCAVLSPAAVVGPVPFGIEEAAELRRSGVEVIVPEQSQEPGGTGWMGSPGRAQAAYLLGRGHTRLGYALPDHPRLHGFAQARLREVATVCAEHGLLPPPARVVPLDVAAASAAVAAWRAEREGPSAICAYNDEVAMAVLAGARALGLEVPQDLAVIGVDDVPVARLAAPALTTVAIDAAEHGRHLAGIVVALLQQAPTPAHDVAAEQVIVRHSA